MWWRGGGWEREGGGRGAEGHLFDLGLQLQLCKVFAVGDLVLLVGGVPIVLSYSLRNAEFWHLSCSTKAHSDAHLCIGCAG